MNRTIRLLAKTFFISAFLVATVGVSVAQAATDLESRDIVFDLDWTIVGNVQGKPPEVSWKYVNVQNQDYRVTEWVGETIARLQKHPEVRISFFSGAASSRNIELLKKIKPPALNGKSLYDVAYKVLSREDLYVDPKYAHQPNAYFTKRYHKDLTKVSSHLENVVLIDDQLRFIQNSGTEGIHLGKTFWFFDSYEDVVKARNTPGLNQRYLPKSRFQWRMERNKMAGASEILEEALNEKPNHRKSFAQMVDEKANRSREAYVNAGVKVLGPALAAPSSGCVNLIQVLKGVQK